MAPKRVFKSCKYCDAADDEGDMVCCDICECWSHFDCVGVTASVSSRKWICFHCRGNNLSPYIDPEHIFILFKTINNP